ncbi:zinc ribbon domain-containing protein [Ktedonosporobacter rubrisoli]|uniref:Zinc ribbon domain-containing protein n=1 Tax=Ktedonosporobacter rubrisoli TaxID=2509675 RepID=A0A4P6K1K2_KTERU|nr:zinc ribbon domain-containing protein [Ktedonosporobacter rubrisoli]QBD82048.1 zinc ribbon domain-containing protein [Ktedonosporobacter rubrisoli]
MNIWDSVQRGLEKATQEAARIAKAQRLRSTIDNLSRQINTGQQMLFSRTMELFATGQLTQSELLSLCQELVSLRQQLEQAQVELKATQGQGVPLPGAQPGPSTAATNLAQPAQPSTGPHPQAGDLAYIPPTPAYQSHFDPTIPVTVPPPPPGVNTAISSLDTISMPAGTSSSGTVPRCTNCNVEIVPGNIYCHNCGAPTQDSDLFHLPTVRGSASEQSYAVADQQTVQDTAAMSIETGEVESGNLHLQSSKEPQIEKDGGQ